MRARFLNISKFAARHGAHSRRVYAHLPPIPEKFALWHADIRANAYPRIVQVSGLLKNNHGDYNHNHRFIRFILSYANLLTLSNIASTLPLEYDDSVQLHLRRVGTCDCALHDSILTTEENMSFPLLISFK